MRAKTKRMEGRRRIKYDLKYENRAGNSFVCLFLSFLSTFIVGMSMIFSVVCLFRHMQTSLCCFSELGISGISVSGEDFQESGLLYLYDISTILDEDVRCQVVL